LTAIFEKNIWDITIVKVSVKKAGERPALPV